MSESNSDNKKTIEDAAISTESSADVKKVKKATKTTKAKKTTESKKTKKVVASEDTVTDKKEAKEAPQVIASQDKEVSKSSIPSSTYLSVAAGILLVVTLTVVTFFQDEFDSVIANLQTISTDSDVEVATQDTGLTVDRSGQMGTQNTPFNNGYQPTADQLSRMNSFNESREKQRAAFEKSIRERNEKIAEMRQQRTAEFERLDKNQAEMRKRIEIMRTKTQQIQLEMQQKMQAAYNEFYAYQQNNNI